MKHQKPETAMTEIHNEGLYERVQTAVDYIRSKVRVNKPQVALIFGSGLTAISSEVDVESELAYDEIPNFVNTTLDFHKGRLLFGKISGREIVAMDGRFHYYEGYSMQDITFPVRMMNALGAEILFVSNISGGLNPELNAGDVVLIVDHINMMGTNPLIGYNDDRLGSRFPDMAEPYSRRLISITEKHAIRLGYHIQRGVYLALPGPMFETRAEYRMIRHFGADMVGMSSVPEVIAAVHGGMEILGLSLISDECFPECLEPLDMNLLLQRAEKGSEVIGSIFQAVIDDDGFISASET